MAIGITFNVPQIAQAYTNLNTFSGLVVSLKAEVCAIYIAKRTWRFFLTYDHFTTRRLFAKPHAHVQICLPAWYFTNALNSSNKQSYLEGHWTKWISWQISTTQTLKVIIRLEDAISQKCQNFSRISMVRFMRVWFDTFTQDAEIGKFWPRTSI